MWLYFVCGRLIPTKHVSDATKESFYMIYIIVTGGLFNVKDRVSSYGYDRGVEVPYISTQLCHRAGIPMG